VIIAHCPHHVVQRGHNSRVVFVDESDYRYYLANLREWKNRLDVKLFAYCLMTNHVHLVLDPGAEVGHIALLVKRLAGRQTRYVNRLERRSGTLWDGRYHSTPVERSSYLLACCRYVDLNPVRAHLVARPEDYPWSSYRQNVGMETDCFLDVDDLYRGLDGSPKGRCEAYAAWVNAGVRQQEADLIRTAVRRGQLTGTLKFIEEVESRTGRRFQSRGRGRPSKEHQRRPPAGK
jgi:putative transposase